MVSTRCPFQLQGAVEGIAGRAKAEFVQVAMVPAHYQLEDGDARTGRVSDLKAVKRLRRSENSPVPLVVHPAIISGAPRHGNAELFSLIHALLAGC
jgi:hypothetical protein